MGLFGGKSDSSPSTPVSSGSPVSSAPREKREASATTSTEAPTVIGKDTIVKGVLESQTDMLVEGRVEGQIKGAKKVIIGESGDVEAKVEAQIVMVRGTVRGDCEGSKKVEITATGKVFGNIASHAIVVAEGATFRGASKMSTSDAAAKPPEPAHEPRPQPSPGPTATTSPS